MPRGRQAAVKGTLLFCGRGHSGSADIGPQAKSGSDSPVAGDGLGVALDDRPEQLLHTAKASEEHCCLEYFEGLSIKTHIHLWDTARHC